ncbi:MAG: hypothetical protein QY326_07765 [Bdellovibrionota bacterium]|nr:MAG: hypothetical protein QY326_07765 [Bdellovibrionota bacterium]
MFPSTARGNNPERWEKFLTALDEKLQLGLLDYLKRVQSYHFEEDVLYIVPGNSEDQKYLQRDAVFQQLQILAQDTTGVMSVKVKAA